MKTEIVGELTQEKDIDWSKSQILINTDKTVIVISNGLHEDGFFSGTLIKTDDVGDYKKAGHYEKEWYKRAFKPCTTPITIKFSND